MFKTIRSYIKLYTKADEESDEATSEFIKRHKRELYRAIHIYKNLKNDNKGESDYITSSVKIETKIELDTKAPELKTAGNRVRKIRKMDDYNVYEYSGVEYIISNIVVGEGYFDQAAGSWT